MILKPSKKRKLEQILLDRSLAPSMTLSRSYIMAGKVLVNERVMDKPGTLISEDASIRLKSLRQYVSRGGLKLEGAIRDLGLSDRFLGRVAFDIGASTGGFTDCLLQHGVSHVYAIDVGTNQLAWKMRTDERVTSLEKTDFRHIPSLGLPSPDWVVADVSFIRLESLIPSFAILGGAHFLLLIKPQFELPRELVPKGGVVEDEGLIQSVNAKICELFTRSGFTVLGMCPSRVPGADGNRESFLFLSKQSS